MNPVNPAIEKTYSVVELREARARGLAHRQIIINELPSKVIADIMASLEKKMITSDSTASSCSFHLVTLIRDHQVIFDVHEERKVVNKITDDVRSAGFTYSTAWDGRDFGYINIKSNYSCGCKETCTHELLKRLRQLQMMIKIEASIKDDAWTYAVQQFEKYPNSISVIIDLEHLLKTRNSDQHIDQSIEMKNKLINSLEKFFHSAGVPKIMVDEKTHSLMISLE
jgi:hypothetical protein